MENGIEVSDRHGGYLMYSHENLRVHPPPLCHPPPENKALLRGYKPPLSLIGPYFLGECGIVGVPLGSHDTHHVFCMSLDVEKNFTIDEGMDMKLDELDEEAGVLEFETHLFRDLTLKAA